MALDASIYSRFAVQPKSVADYDREYAEGESAKQTQQLNALRLLAGQRQEQDAQRVLGEQGAIRNALSQLGAGATDDQRVNALRALGTQSGFSAADSLEKSLLERKKTTATIGKDEAETTGKKLEQAIKAHEFHVQRLGAVASPQDALAWAQEGLKSGVFTPEQYQRGVAALQQVTSPQAFAEWQQRALQGGMSATQQLQAQHQAALLAQQAKRDAETGRHNVVNEKNAAGQLLVSQGNLGVSRDRLKLEKEAPKGVFDPERGLIVDPRTGEARPVTMGGAPVGPKPDKTLGKEAAQKIADAKDAIALLDQAEPLIDAATSSYAGKGVDQAARVFGASTPGAQAAAELKALEGALISKMPKMSGPQSDKDVLLYKQMAGQIGDDTIPAETKKAAIRTIRAINERHSGEAAPKGPKPGAVQDGYRFKGGNPADKANWEKV